MKKVIPANSSIDGAFFSHSIREFVNRGGGAL